MQVISGRINDAKGKLRKAADAKVEEALTALVLQ